MFAKDKVTQAMIDAVKSVLGEEKKELLLEPGKSEKVPTSSGMKVYGHRYGNSAKARKDQTAHEIDKIKGPKDKEMKEAAKPDFLDFDKDGNKTEPMKKALSDKQKMKEELKGNQDKIDANHNNKIDAQDFAILRGKKKIKEDSTFASKLLDSITEKKDVVMPEGINRSDVPAYLRKAKGEKPLTAAEVKSPSKDSISASQNLAKARNEEVELDEKLDTKAKTLDTLLGRKKVPATYDNEHTSPKVKLEAEEAGVTEEELDEMLNEVLSKDATAGDWIHDFVHSDNPKFSGKSKAERKKMALGAYYAKQNEERDWDAHNKNLLDAKAKFRGEIIAQKAAEKLKNKEKEKEKTQKEEVELTESDLHDMAYKHGWQHKQNTYGAELHHPKHGSIGIDRYGHWYHHDAETKATGKVKAHGDYDALEKHLGSLKEATIAGTPGWKKIPANIKDKSGAVHTPMSRAKDLARQAFKKLKSETMMGKAGTTSESKKKW